MVNGGAFVIPVLHEITPVNMNVMRIEVRRERRSALITKNRMRVDLIAEFFVRVGASRQLVAAAAQTLGRRTLQPDGIRDLLEGKFASAHAHRRGADDAGGDAREARRLRRRACASSAARRSPSTGWSSRAWRSSTSTRPASNISTRPTPSTPRA